MDSDYTSQPRASNSEFPGPKQKVMVKYLILSIQNKVCAELIRMGQAAPAPNLRGFPHHKYLLLIPQIGCR